MNDSPALEITFRVAIGLYVLTVAALVAGAIAVSTKEVPVSAYVQAPRVLEKGQPNATRGIVIDGETGRFFIGSDVELRQNGKVFASAESANHGHLHMQFVPDEVESGDVTFTARHRAFDEPYSVGASVTVEEPVEPSWPEPTHRTEDPWEPHFEPFEGPLTVDAFPRTDLVRGLPGLVVLRVSDAETGAPVQATVKITEIEGMVEGDLARSYRSDPLGFVRIELTPATRQMWALEVRTNDPLAPPSTGKIGFDTAPAQYSLRLLSPFVVPGDQVQGIVYSLHRKGGVMVDLYDPDDWVAATAFGLGKDQSGVKIDVPEKPVTPFYRMQIYGNVFGVETAWDAAYIASAPERGLTGCRIALERTLTELAQNDPERWEVWVDQAKPKLREVATASTCARTLDSVLLGIPRHFTPPHLLINSQQAEREELERWKEEVRSSFILLLTFVLAGGLIIVGFLVLRGMAQNRRQRAAIDAATVGLDDLDDTTLSRYEEMLDYARIAIILVSLVGFVLALVMVLDGL